MAEKYVVFKRSCTGWHSFATARKYTQARNLSLEEAQGMCREFNENRSEAQIRKGTKLVVRSQ